MLAAIAFRNCVNVNRQRERHPYNIMFSGKRSKRYIYFLVLNYRCIAIGIISKPGNTCRKIMDLIESTFKLKGKNRFKFAMQLNYLFLLKI